MEGSIRVGMEDNLRVAEIQRVQNNAEWVEKARKIIEALNREITKPDDAR